MSINDIVWVFVLVWFDDEEERMAKICAKITNDFFHQMRPVTSAVSETQVVSHRTKVLEDKDGDGGHQQQHDKHHDPDVSAEGLYRERNTRDITREERDTTHRERHQDTRSPRNAEGDTVPLLRETMTLMPVSMKGTEKSMTSDLSSLMVSDPTAM